MKFALAARAEAISNDSVAAQLCAGMGTPLRFNTLLAGHHDCNRSAVVFAVNGRAFDAFEDEAFIQRFMRETAALRIDRGTQWSALRSLCLCEPPPRHARADRPRRALHALRLDRGEPPALICCADICCSDICCGDNGGKNLFLPMLRITDLRLPLNHTDAALPAAIAARLGIAESALHRFSIFKRSHDARKKSAVVLIYSVDCELDDEAAVLARLEGQPHVRPTPDTGYRFVGHAPADFFAHQASRTVRTGSPTTLQ